ncbi:sporulation integral membrane protein YtvI [Paenibacillus sp. GP183]|uniref:sporulation integral membrane protein YtvI n=1 Tax=Paenibacillus sp. GP183 TaxID=1882751 RepID=UPI00089D148F|nr:sporulation integral membrane protein YtvI [Paenibacillus sp. GP183]SEB89034.1 sporulation integral membrane protein YtvI [Paenibacillus sp. GP183]
MNILNPQLVHQIFRGIWVAVILFLIGLFLYKVTPLVYPFLFGWAIAYLLNPLVNVLQRRAKFPRWLAVTFSMLLFFSATVTCITLFVANIVVEIGTLSEKLQVQINQWAGMYNNFINSPEFQNMVSWVNDFYDKNPQYQDTINKNLTSTANTLAGFSKDSISYILNTIVKLLTSLPNIATLAIITLLATFFISKDWYKIITRYSGIFSETILKVSKLIRSDLQKALFGYLRAQLILVSLTALVVIIGLLILRVDYAITIGLLTGLADLMPYLGTGAVMVPWILYVFFAQGNIYLGIGLSILYGVILVLRQIVEPKVLASSVGLDPLATLIALFVGLKLFGLVGLIIGPVTLVILSAFYRARIFHDIALYVHKGSISEK